MKQLWSVSFFSLFDFCSFFFPSRTDNTCINRTDTIVKISFFFLLFPIRIRLALSLQCIYIYIHVIRNTHLHTGWRRKTNDIQQCIIQSKANVDHHTYILNKHFFFFFFFLLIERQKIILSENKFDYLIASIYQNQDYRERMAFN